MKRLKPYTFRNLQKKIQTLQHQLDTKDQVVEALRQRITHLENQQLMYQSRQSELRLLWHAMNQSASSIVITDIEGRIQYVNPYFTELTGYRLDEVYGEKPNILKSGYTTEDEYNRLWQAITSGEKWSGEFHNRKKNGDLYWEYATISPVTNEQGDITHFVAIKEDITRRKAVEEALRESEIRFRTLVNSMEDIVFTLDLNQRYTGVYGGWLKKNNLTADVFLGKTSRQVFGDEIANVHEAINAQVLQGISIAYEWNNNGQVIHTSLSPLRDSSGVISGIVGIGRDITPLKDIEIQLRESERFARATVDALSAHIAILDENGVILSVNEAWREYAETNNANLSAVSTGVNYLKVLESIDPASNDAPMAQAVFKGIQAVLQGQQSMFSIEYPCHTTKQKHWFLMRVTRFTGEGTVRAVVAHENVTERVLAEQRVLNNNLQLETLVTERTAQLRRLNDRMNMVLNSVSNPVLLIDSDGLIDITNPAFNQTLGYETDELFRTPLWNIFDEPYQRVVKEHFDALRRHDTNLTKPLQVHLITKDNRLIDAEVSLGRSNNKDEHIVCTLYDISHLKEVERVKDEFISMVSHELRTPISSIVLSVGTMQQHYARMTDEQRHRKLTQISEQAHTLTELATSILDVSRFDVRQGKRGTDMVDVARALHDSVAEISGQAESKNQTITIDVINSRVTVAGEHSDILRIWRNLLNNAVKYTPENGSISAKLFGACAPDPCPQRALLDTFADRLPDDIHTGRYIIGMVQDNGHGISQEDMGQLFTRFFRGWATGTNINGTGLGLALVRDLLHLYGGDIAVNSALDAGSTFCFWLPID